MLDIPVFLKILLSFVLGPSQVPLKQFDPVEFTVKLCQMRPSSIHFKADLPQNWGNRILRTLPNALCVVRLSHLYWWEHCLSLAWPSSGNGSAILWVVSFLPQAVSSQPLMDGAQLKPWGSPLQASGRPSQPLSLLYPLNSSCFGLCHLPTPSPQHTETSGLCLCPTHCPGLETLQAVNRNNRREPLIGFPSLSLADYCLVFGKSLLHMIFLVF